MREERERRETDRLHHLQRLRHEQGASLVDAVGDRAGDGGEKEDGVVPSTIEWEELATPYRDKDFLPSWGLAHLAKVLTGAPG